MAISNKLLALAVPIAGLTLDPRNTRRHDRRGIDAVKASLVRFSQLKPIVVQEEGMIVRAGNATVVAAVELGWTEIAANIKSMTDGEAAAYAIADNRTAELASWDDEVLAETIKRLQEDPTIEEVVTGFSQEDMSELFARISPPEIVEDEVPEPPEEPITKPGDLWLLGDHRVLCGDSTKAEDVERVMGGEKAGLCFTSPPYAQQRDYTEASDVSDWDGLMRGVFANLLMTAKGQVLVNLGLIHRDGEWVPYWQDWIEWMREQGWRRFGWYVWDKLEGLPGDWNGRLRPAHEWIFHFNRAAPRPLKISRCKHVGEAQSSTGMRAASGKINNWTQRGEPVAGWKVIDSVIRCVPAKVTFGDHPASFSVQLAMKMLGTYEGDTLDPFLGSGTTLIAVEQLGRRCYGIEIEARYVDVTVQRWEKLTGRKAELAA